jgi:CheY-like chemotaxis protein
MQRQPRILVVDDTPRNIRVLEATLEPRGYTVLGAPSGADALLSIAGQPPDLVLLDVVMPGMDGYEVCRRLRADPATQFLPVIMVTASGDQEKRGALEAGADDFIQKPFNQAELLARVASLLRIKESHDTIQRQTAELAEWNRTLESRVSEPVTELERLGRLRRFLAPQVAELLVSAEGEALLESHRRQISVVCCQLPGFSEPNSWAPGRERATSWTSESASVSATQHSELSGSRLRRNMALSARWCISQRDSPSARETGRY